MHWKRSFLLLIFMLVCLFAKTQSLPQVHIRIIDEATRSENNEVGLENSIQEEIKLILRNRYEVECSIFYGDFQLEKIIEGFEEAFADPKVDIVITSGALSSGLLARRDRFSKPAIAATILDNDLQKVPLTSEGSSGVDNFTYLQTPFNISRDLQTLYRIHPFKKVGFLGSAQVANVLSFPLSDLLEQATRSLGVGFTIIPVQDNAETSLAQIPEDVDAIYLLPIFDELTIIEKRELFAGINERRLPSAAILGEREVEEGILMGYEAENNLQMIPRRIATNVLKILEGQNPANLSVKIPTYTETLIINMATARQTDYYPDFDLMAEAIMIKFNEVKTDRRLSLQTVIAEALANNLNVQISQKDVRIAEQDVAIAGSNLLPQIDAITSLTLIDERSAENSFGAQGRLNWTVQGNLSQVILSEPALANIAIQKFLKEGQSQAFRQTQLDIIQEATTAYLNVLQSQTFVRIQRDNVLLTKENYDIAQAKEAVGYTGATDINRWQSELAQSNIELNNNQAQYRQAQFRLNQLLNRPINQKFNTEDVLISDQMLLVTDERILDLINNYGDLERFADFLVEEGMQQLPEIKQIQASLNAQERQRKSQLRTFYIPSLQLSGNVSYLIQRWNTFPPPSLPGMGGESFGSFADQVPTWNVGLGLRYPIFSGDQRRRQLGRIDVTVAQLQDQQALIRQQLELRIRSALEIASASFSRVQLAEEAAQAARKNFDIVQDSYSQGLVNVTSLIDAQNASLQASLSAENAVYQFIIDFLEVERSVGSYYFLTEKEDRDQFFERLNTYLLSKE